MSPPFMVNRFRSTHLDFAKWNMNLAPLEKMLERKTGGVERLAPIDLISFPADAGEWFIRSDGGI